MTWDQDSAQTFEQLKIQALKQNKYRDRYCAVSGRLYIPNVPEHAQIKLTDKV